MSTSKCPSCGAPAAPQATECRYCGEALAAQASAAYQAPPQQQQPQGFAPPPPNFGQQPHSTYSETHVHQVFVNHPQAPVYRNPKNKVLAGILGIFLGGFGIHKFYLGRIFWGIVYVLFCWTYIPMILGFIEGIIYLASSEDRFHRKYSR